MTINSEVKIWGQCVSIFLSGISQLTHKNLLLKVQWAPVPSRPALPCPAQLALLTFWIPTMNKVLTVNSWWALKWLQLTWKLDYSFVTKKRRQTTVTIFKLLSLDLRVLQYFSSQYFFNDYFYTHCVLCPHICKYTECVPGAWGSPKRVLDVWNWSYIYRPEVPSGRWKSNPGPKSNKCS